MYFLHTGKFVMAVFARGCVLQVRIFGSQSGAAIASKIIDEPGLATSTSLGSHSGASELGTRPQ